MQTGFWWGELEGKRPLERPRRTWEDNIKWIFKKWERGSVDWIRLARDRARWRALANATVNLSGVDKMGGISCPSVEL